MDNKTDGCDINRTGLTGVQAAENRLKYGDNVLTPPARTSMWLLYIEKYDDPIIRILLVAAAVSLALAFVNGEFVETVGIFFAIFLATTIGFFFERDAARKFDVLTAIGEEQPVKVVRDGKVCEIARREVTVGDVVMVEVGDEVPADGFLFEATDLQIDESALTGEPVTDKYVNESHVSTAAVSENSSIDNVMRNADEAAYPADMLLRSTMVMNGNGRMVVTAVGDGTEIGRVAHDATELTAVKTPLNRQLDRLASMISKVGVTVAMAAFVVFLGHDVLTQPLWHTDDYVQMAGVVLRYFMMAVTLIVMAVPEGLPMAVTLALALNMRRMLKSNNLVRKLHACETMGAVTVICTDKTGTLTQNKMRVNEIEVLPVGDDSKSGYSFPSLALSFALNTTAELDDSRGIGNPTEVALLRWLTGHGADYRALRASVPIEERLPFSTERKYMATLCDVDGVRWLFVKGAPEIVMARCVMTDEERTRVTGMLAGWQNKAMRTLAFACRRCDTMEVSDMTLQCVAAISDPLREEVPDAIRSCISAGINVKIVTGDTSATAMEIARQIGMSLTAESVITGPEFAALGDDEALERVSEIRVMSRARPADKQRLVNLLQRRGEVVAVTGDGTNDAPALNHAHVGLSLGSGTSVAKNASDMTLIDDSFNSIVSAVEWGRSLYNNIRRFIFFQLVVNVTALLLVLGGSFIGTEMPLTITQILWVNLIMDTFAAMALASLPPETEVMNDRPRSQADFIVSRSMARAISVVGAVFFVTMLSLLYYFEHIAGLSDEELTVFFTVFVMLQWWNLFNAKALGSCKPALQGMLKDRGLLLVLAIIIAGQWIIVTFGGRMFRTVPLDAFTWLWIVAATSPVLIAGELWRWMMRIKRTGKH